jgi:hypothetical protein
MENTYAVDLECFMRVLAAGALATRLSRPGEKSPICVEEDHRSRWQTIGGTGIAAGRERMPGLCLGLVSWGRAATHGPLAPVHACRCRRYPLGCPRYVDRGEQNRCIFYFSPCRKYFFHK